MRLLTLFTLGSLAVYGCGSSFQAEQGQGGMSGASQAGGLAQSSAGNAVNGQAGDGAAGAAEVGGESSLGAAGMAEETGGSTPSAGSGSTGTAGAGGTTCPARALFCDDFDDGAFGARWDTVDHKLASLDTTQGFSKPNSLHLALAAQRAETAGILKKELTDVGDVLRVSFYLRINQATEIYPFGLFYPTNDYQISLHLGGAVGSLSVAEQTSGKFGNGKNYDEQATTAALLADKQWKHVEVTINSATGRISVRIDETTVLDDAQLRGADFVRGGKCALGLGIYYAFAQTTWDANFDDVVVTSP